MLSDRIIRFSDLSEKVEHLTIGPVQIVNIRSAHNDAEVTMKTEFKVNTHPHVRLIKILTFQFSNLLGTVYSQGNLLFSPDGTCLLSPVGNRVTVFDLVKYAAVSSVQGVY